MIVVHQIVEFKCGTLECFLMIQLAKWVLGRQSFPVSVIFKMNHKREELLQFKVPLLGQLL